MGAKGELHDQEMEHHRETEALLESVRQFQRELLFAQLVLDQSVPEQQQRFIERQMHWDETAGDWQLRCIVCPTEFWLFLNTNFAGLHGEQHTREQSTIQFAS